jgi:protocatechuate 3,4-dioxygenase beta subunit
MKKVTIILFAVLIISRSTSAGTITGTVVRELDGAPVKDLQVQVLDYFTGQEIGSDYTSDDGLYVISGLAEGMYTIKILTWYTVFVEQYYDNVHDPDNATPIFVPAVGVVQGINFRLVVGGTIAGVVTDSDGVPIPDLWVSVSDYDSGRYCGRTNTDYSGFYVIPRLAEGTYLVSVSTQGTDFIGEHYDNALCLDDATPVLVPKSTVVQNINFSLDSGSLRVSGKVTDKVFGFALENILVTYWNDYYERWNSTNTDNHGRYMLTGLLPGEVSIAAEPNYTYASVGKELVLTEDVNNIDFELPRGASLTTKVIDAETYQALRGVEINYWNNRFKIWRSDFTNFGGEITFTNLPPGITEVAAKPSIDSGYAWNPPRGSNWIYIDEGVNINDHIITLHKGALVSGLVVDSEGNPFGDFECDYRGRLCEGEVETNSFGRYEMRLPVGTYIIASDEDEYRALPREVTIRDLNSEYNVDDIIAYSEESGDRISGSVNNPLGYQKNGDFIIVTFEAGTVIDPNTWFTIEPVSDTDINEAGPFTISRLPQEVNYDVFLFVASETNDEIMSHTVIDKKTDIPVGRTDVKLDYVSEGGTIKGKVLETTGKPVLKAQVILNKSATNQLAGFADTDQNGEFIIYNVPAGAYTATAIHSQYLNSSETVLVTDGEQNDVNDIIMTFYQ